MKVQGRVNGAQGATISIDRERGLVSVRPFRERREYTLPLQTIAEIVVVKVVKAELERKVS